ncbi:hypothetical protein ACHAXR_004400 [Thalassiosira sp. AJA248-18]
MTVHQDVVSNDATIINPNSSPKTRRRILFLSLEFNFSPFSGNGVLARSLVSSLVRRDDCTVRVICARPHRSAPGISQDIFMTTTSSNSSNDDDLEIWPVDLPQHSQWKRLDRSGPWQEYATACGEDYEQRLGSFARLVNEFQPTDVVAVDWHGMLAWESILRSNKRRGDVMTVGNNGTSSSSSWQPSSVNVCYYNFRVYSSSSWGHSSTTTSQSDKAEKEESDDQFYREREQLSCRLANVIICLAEHDKCMIQRLVEDDDNAAQKEEPMERNIKNIHILHPPLRGDLRQLANTNETVERLNHHLPPEVKHAIEKTSISKQRLFITCMARLSPEKSPHHFVSLLQKLGGIDFLRRNELIPIICGARGVQDYAMKVVDDFQSLMCSDSSEEGETTITSWPCVVIDRHLGPKELGAMFSRTVVNFHVSDFCSKLDFCFARRNMMLANSYVEYCSPAYTTLTA